MDNEEEVEYFDNNEDLESDLEDDDDNGEKEKDIDSVFGETEEDDESNEDENSDTDDEDVDDTKLYDDDKKFTEDDKDIESLSNDYSEVSEVNYIKVTELKRSNVSYFGKNVNITKVNKYKFSKENNRLNKYEFITILSDLTKLYQLGMEPLFEVEKYPHNTEETTALLTLLKRKTNIYVIKDEKIYSVDNYPINDILNIFRIYLPFMLENDNLYKREIIDKHFPNLINDLLSRSFIKSKEIINIVNG